MRHSQIDISTSPAFLLLDVIVLHGILQRSKISSFALNNSMSNFEFEIFARKCSEKIRMGSNDGVHLNLKRSDVTCARRSYEHTGINCSKA